MDAYSEKQADDPALTGIISMLMALAVLAEQASGRSLPVRSFVLWVLRVAEAIVREMAGDAAQAPREAGLSFFRHGEGRADCIRLAMRIRALAQTLAERQEPCSAATPLWPAARVSPIGGVAAFAVMLKLLISPLDGVEERSAQRTKSPKMGFSSERKPEPIGEGRMTGRPEGARCRMERSHTRLRRYPDTS